MLVFSSFFWIYPLVFSSVLLFPPGGKMVPSRVPKPLETSNARSISLVIRTDHDEYSLRDAVKLNASLQNTGDTRVYVDRRMFWTGYAGGLLLEIKDEKGNPVPARLLSDALMPPPREKDASILIPLDQGYFYGTSVNLLVADVFKKPGKYSIRVTYKSWLSKEFVPRELRKLPALWADSPEIVSEPVWIEVTP
jgi:hypothetical protein